MFCFHRLGAVAEGYQYCTRCGKAFRTPCSHSWKDKEIITITNNSSKVGRLYVLQCSKCGDIKKVEVQPTPLIEGWR